MLHRSRLSVTLKLQQLPSGILSTIAKTYVGLKFIGDAGNIICFVSILFRLFQTVLKTVSNAVLNYLSCVAFCLTLPTMWMCDTGKCASLILLYIIFLKVCIALNDATQRITSNDSLYYLSVWCCSFVYLWLLLLIMFD